MERTVRYTVAMHRPSSHLLDITMEINDGGEGPLELVMPVWTPGSYLVREYSRNVQDLRASDTAGNAVEVRKTQKNRWRVERVGASPVRVTYRTYARELTVRTNFLDDERALINGAATFMFVEGLRDIPLQISVVTPRRWSAVTAMAPSGDHTFMAQDFDELVDSPILCGELHQSRFEVVGVPHLLAISGSGNFDAQVLTRDLERIVLTASDIFGGLPYSHYVFLLLLAETGSGGLEHRDSNTCLLPRLTFKPPRNYERFLAVEAHEHFHAWLVKRIRPRTLIAFDYTGEQYTRLLWVMEGLTEYYADQILLRAGLISSDRYLERLAEDIGKLQQIPGRMAQSLEDASFDAWIKLYRPDENSDNSSVSYYLKGCLVGAVLDLKIIAETAGARSLDDVLRALWKDPDIRERGIEEDAFQAIAERASGVRLGEFFQHYVRGVSEIPWDAFFAPAGLRLEPVAGAEAGPYGYLGARFQREGQYAIVESVAADGPAWEAGITPGDEIIAMDGFRVLRTDIDSRLETVPPGTTVDIALIRQGVLRSVPVQIGSQPADKFRIVADEGASPQQVAIRRRWLRQH